MIYLEKKASELYFYSSRFYFHTETLSWAHYLDRMLALKNMCESRDPIYNKASRILLVEEWNHEDDWAHESNESSRDEFDENGEVPSGISRDEKGYLQLLLRIQGLNDWVFHQYDVDFHPSIPHGHLKDKKQQKLDSYLGWIYQGAKQTGRLSRNSIIALWNNEDFRFFAETAIGWYIEEYPCFKWRVKNPRMLPRRRKRRTKCY